MRISIEREDDIYIDDDLKSRIIAALVTAKLAGAPDDRAMIKAAIRAVKGEFDKMVDYLDGEEIELDEIVRFDIVSTVLRRTPGLAFPRGEYLQGCACGVYEVKAAIRTN